MTKPKSKLVISHKKDYPITSSFPHTLETLVVADLNLKRVDSRMLKLRQLKRLDLSDNVLGPDVGDALGQMRCLQRLGLARNGLAVPPSFRFCRSRLSDTLTHLDLSGNRLRDLPPHVCYLSSLVTLELQENALERLPLSLGRLARLRFLNADKNRLQTLPGGLVKLGLEKLDLSGNPFRPVGDSGAVLLDRLGFPSLSELCLALCLRKRIPLEAGEVAGPVLRDFDARESCRCGRVCFGTRAVVLNAIPLLSVCSQVSADQDSVLFEAVVCSRGCLNRYATNQFAF